jgi:peptidase T
MENFKKSVAERFLRYTAFDTMSNPALAGVKRPTSEGQIVLLKALVEEARELGLEAELGPDTVTRVVLKGNTKAPVIGFMAHVDTADDVPGDGVKARLIHYEGGDITLPSGLVLSVADNPELEEYVGSDIITSDGTTLLGSDDKAGVAIIMEGLKYLVAHPEIKHGDIEVFFTPDEETGAGMDGFDYATSHGVAVYTIDGGDEHEIEAECFNAATMTIEIEGVSIHLGSGRGKLVNAIKIASAIIGALPQSEAPESTDERYGYYHVGEISGTSTSAKMSLYIRDFDEESFNRRIKTVENLASLMAETYHGKVKVSTRYSYKNMGAVNRTSPKAVEAIFRSAEKLGLTVHEELIRGGTDGARMAEAKKIPTPNLFTGGHNLHSLSEWVAVDGMDHSVSLMLEIIKYWAE